MKHATSKLMTKLGCLLSAALIWLPAQQASGAEIVNTGFISYTYDGIAATQPSNTVRLLAADDPTPAVVTFHHFAPSAPSATVTPIAGGQCSSSGGVYSGIPRGELANGQPLPDLASLPIVETSVMHAGEPVFIKLRDLNRNANPAAIDEIEIVVTTSVGDKEQLKLKETGNDTGEFATAIQSRLVPPAVQQFNCELSVEHTGSIKVDYVDSFYPTDVAEASVLVDPYGVVFNTVTGEGISGITISLINVDTGQPATVFGDDGVSSYPSTMVTGQSVTDAAGITYNFIQGGYRFPFIPPGNYRLVVIPPPGFTIPSTLPLSQLQGLRDALGNPYAITTGSFGEVFTVLAGSPALNIDVPADPPAGFVTGQRIIVQKQASRASATVGDFIEYSVRVTNNAGRQIGNVVTTDELPVGFRYRRGSARLNGAAIDDPVISSNGRVLTFTQNTLLPAQSVVYTYVTEIAAGAREGQAINTASATAVGGLASNRAQARVTVRAPFFGNCGIVVGRVVEGACDADWNTLKGVGGVRIMLEDGTYTTTDKDGMYHFERVCDGTHVVQMDLETLADDAEPASCIQNTRFAGRSFSQFVEARGGGLMRADFWTRKRPAVQGPMGIRLMGALTPPAMTAVPEHRTLGLNWDTRKAALNPQVQGQLDAVIASLRGMDVDKITVVGHTDNVRIAPENRHEFADNGALSRARAATAVSYLQQQLGLPASAVESRGMAESQPIASNATAEGRARNRRTEIIVLPRSKNANGPELSYRVELDGGKVPVNALKATVMLPEGIVPMPGTVRVDGNPAADAEVMDSAATFALGDVGSQWRRVVEFKAKAPAGACPAQGYQARAMAQFSDSSSVAGKTPVVAAVLPCQAVEQARQQRLTGVVHFDSRKLGIKDAYLLDQAANTVAGSRVVGLDVIGHADGQRIAPENTKEFRDNQVLSESRANAVRDYLSTKLSLDSAAIQLSGRSNLEPVAGNDTPEGMAQNRRAEFALTAVNGQATAMQAASAASERAETQVQGAADSLRKARKPLVDPLAKRRMMLSDAEAAGSKTTWLEGQSAGSALLFPPEGHNPRAPAVRVVVKHAPGSQLKLTINGAPVSQLAYEQTDLDASRTVAVSSYSGVSINTGNNLLVVEEFSGPGQRVARHERVVHFANVAQKAEILPEQSLLVADGVTTPVIAVRITDAQGRPVRNGMTGPFVLDPPYQSAELLRRQQERQLAGLDAFSPTFRVEGDDGVAYIELQPTTASGYADLHFTFQDEQNAARRQDLRTWMASEAREWVIVGFAEGTVGYNTLSNKAEATAAGANDSLYTDGQVAFYAKGRIKGEWLATVAYDTRKTRDPNGLTSLSQVINPNEYFQIYGDGAEQRFDAPSQRRIYVKLEKGRFYALFGDHQTGMTQTQLSRYTRALNGLKSEYAGDRYGFTLFASDTSQNYVREDIQGNGTSGLYRLSRRNLVINGERIALVTRDRFRSELIKESRALFRYVDYDIDYTNGTLLFKMPVPTRDVDLNPVFIQAEYEVQDGGSRHLNAGGRATVSLMDNALNLGTTVVHEESDRRSVDLQGVDARYKIATDTEVRAEVARTDNGVATANAYLAEVEHHAQGFDVLAYARRQETGFGLDQQAGFEAGLQKVGVVTRIPLSDTLSANVEAYQHDAVGANSTRQAASARVEYRPNKDSRVFAGAQFARDETDQGSAQSTLASLGGGQTFMDGKLDVQARSDIAVGGQDGNIDYPSRYTVQVGYDVTESTKLVLAQEFTQGGSYDASTTRVGAIANPWKGARLNSTLAQSIDEFGPRTYALYGINQNILLGEHWGLDIGVDRSQTFNQSGQRPVVSQTNGFPVSAGGVQGGIGGGNFVQQNTEDYTAGSLGVTYRADDWSATTRAEFREGQREDRRSINANFIRQAKEGVAFAGGLQAFAGSNSGGTSGNAGNVNFSLAYRPLGSRWSVLERLEYRQDAVQSGTGVPGGGLFGANSLNVQGNARSRAIVNHLAFNRVSRKWDATDRQGNLFTLNQRAQFAVFYGLKYSTDRFNGQSFSGLTDFLGTEYRYDLTPMLDVGVQASVLHSYEQGSFAYSAGPSVGGAPIDNLWVSLGYNVVGFEDRDFDEASYTAQGPYLQTRFKFDQFTRIGGMSAANSSGNGQ